MDAASLDAAGFDFDDLGFLDGLECFDLDLLPADFFLAGPGKDGGLDLDLGSPDHGGRESSPDSVVTDDGAPSSSSGDRGDDGGEMSDYVSELERFLMEDDHDIVSGGRAMAEEKELAADDYILGGYFGADDGCAVLALGAETAGAEEELSADSYFLDDYYVADDAYADAAMEDAVSARAEEELATNGEYFFGGDNYVTDNDLHSEPAADNYVTDNDLHSEPAAVVDPASPVSEEEDFAAAREDETTSRKRASIHPLRQSRCAASVPGEAELVLTRRGRCILVQSHGCRRLGHHRS
ncbi:unnamed protein product [Alopecurus aequalis]